MQAGKYRHNDFTFVCGASGFICWCSDWCDGYREHVQAGLIAQEHGGPATYGHVDGYATEELIAASTLIESYGGPRNAPET